MTLELVKQWRVFDGELRRYRHTSSAVGVPMVFAVFVPPAALAGGAPAPVMLWLSGLTCTDENFSQKAGAFGAAAQHGVAIVMPDTSPRGDAVVAACGPDVNSSWDFGIGAGFYLDATQAPYSTHFKMYSYVTQELPALLANELSRELDASRMSVSGHSMGGYGALQLALRNPGRFRCATAFCPISHPSAAPWGEKAFTRFLGSREEAGAAWAAHDPTELVKGYSGPALHLVIDQGAADEFLEKGQLRPDDFVAAAKAAGVPVEYACHEGYDHSYFFVSSYIAKHIAHHAKHLKA